MKFPYSIDLLIFDLDGTLIDSREDLAASTNEALRRLGLPELPTEQIALFIGEGVQKLMERALGEAHLNLLEEAVQLFREAYSRHLVERTRLYPGVPETLASFREKKKAIVSNKPYDFTVEIVRRLGIESHFTKILGGDSTRNRKPHPEPVERLLEALHVAPKRAAVVGDSPLDVEMGKRAGLLTIAVTYGLRPREELASAKPDLLIDRFSDLIRYLC